MCAFAIQMLHEPFGSVRVACEAIVSVARAVLVASCRHATGGRFRHGGAVPATWEQPGRIDRGLRTIDWARPPRHLTGRRGSRPVIAPRDFWRRETER